jgi:hypothetical protein
VKNLNENGLFFLEINQKLGKETLELFKNFSESELVKDLSGNDRFVMGRKVILSLINKFCRLFIIKKSDKIRLTIFNF